MMDRASPLWWVFAAGTAALQLAVMFPGMVTRGQKIFVSCGPVATFLALMAFSAVNGWPLTRMLPCYCAINLGIITGMLGHRKALRSYMADRAENPSLPEDGTATPWALQMALTLPVFLGLAFWYMRG
ncbi:hypothetical protein DEJ46_23555 [Streptomyces venezuelae]|uniref:Uncharacterized protein n=2 Tax=Streptomyces TaxID=1883 RepID=A0A5P2ATU0_STRVZ|nr:hypothetical protein DEJ46_23555 [Streptomyces venezuelae]